MAFGVAACVDKVQPPVRVVMPPPAPSSVTQKEPGGDAENPEVAAFDRLLAGGFGLRSDKRDTVSVPLADWQTWRRVRFFLVPSYTGFRYGDAHHGVAALYVDDAPKPDATAEDCVRVFEKTARQFAEGIGADFTDPVLSQVTWRDQHLTVRSREGSVMFGFGRKSWAGTYAGYVPWPNTCAVLAYGFPMGEAADLARQVRDRFAREAFSQFDPKGKERPPPEK